VFFLIVFPPGGSVRAKGGFFFHFRVEACPKVLWGVSVVRVVWIRNAAFLMEESSVLRLVFVKLSGGPVSSAGSGRGGLRRRRRAWFLRS